MGRFRARDLLSVLGGDPDDPVQTLLAVSLSPISSFLSLGETDK